ncbi:hypothetical protein [Streptomyces sp. NBC_01304]|uniref:hypothetical protein n=1 Tax=Streptomyces sp. NBC_01304 TaxID=2903818 RepID=UPI002E15452F|nr:hypothetical protein OG430_10870 [Streptomyces sp. NBC_01304]
MRSLPLLLAGRLLPVVALATAGWAWTSGPYAPAPAAKPAAAPSPKASDARKYRKPPAPCETMSADTVKDLVPGAKTKGKELDLSDPARRRTCSWSALKGYDYRWLDVSYEVIGSAKQARPTEPRQGESVPDLGDKASVSVDLTTKDKQHTREAVVTVRASNALITVTYNGSDFESKGAPGADTMRKGALKAAKEAVAGLGDPT